MDTTTKPPDPPDQQHSCDDASKAENKKAKTADGQGPSSNTILYAQEIREKHRRSSLEPPIAAAASMAAPPPVPPPSSASAWPSIIASPAQVLMTPSTDKESKTLHGEKSRDEGRSEHAKRPGVCTSTSPSGAVVEDDLHRSTFQPSADLLTPATTPSPPVALGSTSTSVLSIPDQRSPATHSADAHSGQRLPDFSGVVKPAKKMTGSKASQGSRAFSYADMARKNLPAPKQMASQQPHFNKKPEPVDNSVPAISHEKPVASESAASDRPTEHMVGSLARSTNRPASTPELLIAIQDLARTTEPRTPTEGSLESAEMSSEVAEQKPQSLDKLPVSELTMSQQKKDNRTSPRSLDRTSVSDLIVSQQKTEEESAPRSFGRSSVSGLTVRQQKEEIKTSPLKTRTWASVVRGGATTARPTGSTMSSKAPAPHLQPRTPHLQPAKSLNAPEISHSVREPLPNKTTASPNKHKRMQSSSESGEASKAMSSGRQPPKDRATSLASEQPASPEQKMEASGPQAGIPQKKKKKKTKSVDFKEKGKGKAAASPSSKSVPDSSNPNPASNSGGEADRQVPVLPGNLATHLQRRPVGEELASQQQQQREDENHDDLQQTLPVPYPGHPTERRLSAGPRPQLPQTLQAGPLDPTQRHGRNAAWPALPSQQRSEDNIPAPNPLNISAASFQPRQPTVRNALAFSPQPPALQGLTLQTGTRSVPVRAPAPVGFDGSTEHGHSAMLHSPFRVAYQPATGTQLSPIYQGFRQAESGLSRDQEMQRGRELEQMGLHTPRTLANLWRYELDRDVLVRCGATRWKVHRHVLITESPWFAERLPPRHPTARYVEFDCNGHDPQNLNSALVFMYHHYYPNATLPAQDLLNGDCIYNNVVMYLCGAAVDCASLKKYAIAALENITAVLARIVPTMCHDPGLHRLYDPVRRSMKLLLNHGNVQYAFDIRLAIARLVDVTLMFFLKNRRFRVIYPEWVREVYFIMTTDSVLFRAMLLIGEDEDPERAARGEQIRRQQVAMREAMLQGQTVVLADDEDGEDEDLTPRVEEPEEEGTPTGRDPADEEEAGPAGEELADQEVEPTGGGQVQEVEDTGEQAITLAFRGGESELVVSASGSGESDNSTVKQSALSQSPSVHDTPPKEQQAEATEQTASQETAESAPEVETEVWCLRDSKY